MPTRCEPQLAPAHPIDTPRKALRLTALPCFAQVAITGNSLLTCAALVQGLIGPGAFAAIRLGAGAAMLA